MLTRIFKLIEDLFAQVFVWALRALAQVLRVLPVKLWSIIAWIITPVAWIVLKRRRREALKNIQTVLALSSPDAKKMGKASFHSNLLVLFESLALTRLLDQDDVRIEVKITPEARSIIEGLQTGEITMAIALSGHSGVWELIGVYLARLVNPASAVVASKLPRNPIIASFLRQIRSRHGLTLIDKTRFARHIVKQIHNDSSFLNMFLCDQHFNRDGAVRVPFLGKSACTVSLPATIMQKYKVPTIIGHCIRKSPTHYLIELEAIETEDLAEYSAEDAVIELTTRISNKLSSYISQAPEQWTWGHRRWRKCCSILPQ